ncbi:MAG TPA: copper transporter [Acidimicrobiales bacterium]|nr:copper transporter [Acidimicrobiales bacterium]
MINLRYHIVSLVAVFLALGLGIVMGSTVIDRVTVDALNNRLDDVQRSVGAIRDENGRLKSQVDRGLDFAETTRDQLLRGHLRGIPVMIVAVAGIDRGPVDELRQALVGAQATMQGTIWFTNKMRLANDGDVRALADAVGLSVDRPDPLRRQALAKVANAREAATSEASPLAALSNAGFITYEGPPGGVTSTTAPLPSSLASLPLANTRYVVVSGAGAEVGDGVLAVPLVQAFAQVSGRVVAAESGQDTEGGRAVFVGLLRGDVVSARLSTVDNLESPMGQTATVLALEDLGVPQFGHYGVGPGAQRILPAPAA